MTNATDVHDQYASYVHDQYAAGLYDELAKRLPHSAAHASAASLGTAERARIMMTVLRNMRMKILVILRLDGSLAAAGVWSFDRWTRIADEEVLKRAGEGEWRLGAEEAIDSLSRDLELANAQVRQFLEDAKGQLSSRVADARGARSRRPALSLASDTPPAEQTSSDDSEFHSDQEEELEGDHDLDSSEGGDGDGGDGDGDYGDGDYGDGEEEDGDGEEEDGDDAEDDGDDQQERPSPETVAELDKLLQGHGMSASVHLRRGSSGVGGKMGGCARASVVNNALCALALRRQTASALRRIKERFGVPESLFDEGGAQTWAAAAKDAVTMYDEVEADMSSKLSSCVRDCRNGLFDRVICAAKLDSLRAWLTGVASNRRGTDLAATALEDEADLKRHITAQEILELQRVQTGFLVPDHEDEAQQWRPAAGGVLAIVQRVDVIRTFLLEDLRMHIDDADDVSAKLGEQCSSTHFVIRAREVLRTHVLPKLADLCRKAAERRGMAAAEAAALAEVRAARAWNILERMLRGDPMAKRR